MRGGGAGSAGGDIPDGLDDFMGGIMVFILDKKRVVVGGGERGPITTRVYQRSQVLHVN